MRKFIQFLESNIFEWTITFRAEVQLQPVDKRCFWRVNDAAFFLAEKPE
jgi:hypothetical protein